MNQLQGLQSLSSAHISIPTVQNLIFDMDLRSQFQQYRIFFTFEAPGIYIHTYIPILEGPGKNIILHSTAQGLVCETQGWQLKRLLSFTKNRIANRLHRPRDPDLREIMDAIGVVGPEPQEPEPEDEEEEGEEEICDDDEEVEEDGGHVVPREDEGHVVPRDDVAPLGVEAVTPPPLTTEPKPIQHAGSTESFPKGDGPRGGTLTAI